MQSHVFFRDPAQMLMKPLYIFASKGTHINDAALSPALNTEASRVGRE